MDLVTVCALEVEIQCLVCCVVLTAKVAFELCTVNLYIIAKLSVITFVGHYTFILKLDTFCDMSIER